MELVSGEEEKNIQNPGSAIGEAIGANMEIALNRFLDKVVSDFYCNLISKGEQNPKTLKDKKLLLFDSFGNEYNIDAVVTSEKMQPLVLIEYKYIRYTKHNRDKGSWLCTAHPAVRRRYESVRSSIAILAGNWSRSSLAMMKSHDVNCFIIPFQVIVDILKDYEIDFEWGEKEREKAALAWDKYSELSDEDQLEIAERMIEGIKEPLKEILKLTLDDEAIREIKRVSVEIHTSVGEVKLFEFDSIEEAIAFLEDFSIEEMFDIKNALGIFDRPALPGSESAPVTQIGQV